MARKGHTDQMTPNPKKNKRLSKSEWLDRAMDVVAKSGGARLTVERLCKEVGVTKGSFYAHFKNHDDFVGQFVMRWSQTSTQSVISAISKLADETAEARLLALMRQLYQIRITGLELAIRAWATRNSNVAKGVQETDGRRYDYVRRIFHDMGFRGLELDLRTRIFVVYHGGEASMRLPSSRLARDEELKLRQAFFCRR